MSSISSRRQAPELSGLSGPIEILPGTTAIVTLIGRPVRSRRLALRQLLLGIALRLPDPWRPSEQGTMYIESVDRFERAEHNGQEQLCVPLAPASTYWYLEAVPELLELVSRRLEQLPGALS